MAKRFDLTGKRFGKLTVVSRIGSRCGKSEWLCRCECGQETKSLSHNLKSGQKKSCGCLVKTHGQSRKRSRAYNCWLNMRARCNNPKNPQFSDYGGRGISVCARWDEFTNFLADMGEPGNGLSLDRIDNEGDYTPENCRWATSKEQNNNCRTNVSITHRGKERTLKQWSEKTGLNYQTLRTRIRNGWSDGRLLTSPADSRNRNSNVKEPSFHAC